MSTQSFTKYLRQALIFMWDSEVREGDWALGYNSMKFGDLEILIFPNF